MALATAQVSRCTELWLALLLTLLWKVLSSLVFLCERFCLTFPKASKVLVSIGACLHWASPGKVPLSTHCHLQFKSLRVCFPAPGPLLTPPFLSCNDTFSLHLTREHPPPSLHPASYEFSHLPLDHPPPSKHPSEEFCLICLWSLKHIEVSEEMNTIWALPSKILTIYGGRYD